MRRLVHTSAGPVELDFFNDAVYRTALAVHLRTYDQDTGWEMLSEHWRESGEDRPLGLFLKEVLRIPETEAEQIASESLGEWRARKGPERTRREMSRMATPIAAIFALAGIGAIAAIVVVVVAVLKLI